MLKIRASNYSQGVVKSIKGGVIVVATTGGLRVFQKPTFDVALESTVQFIGDTLVSPVKNAENVKEYLV